MFDPASHPVLLGSLEPVVALGLHRSLTVSGVEVVIEPGSPSEVAALASRMKPYAVVLGLESPSSTGLLAWIRRAAPATKVLLLARDEDTLEVLDPGMEQPRRFCGAVADRLAGELRPPSVHPIRSSTCRTT